MHFAPYLKKAACGMGSVFPGSILEQGLLSFICSSCWQPWKFAELAELWISLIATCSHLVGSPSSMAEMFPTDLLSYFSPHTFMSPWEVVQEVCIAGKGRVSSQPLRTTGFF